MIPPVKRGGFTLYESVVEVGEEGQISIMLANTTNTTIKIPRDREVGRAVSASLE